MILVIQYIFFGGVIIFFVLVNGGVIIYIYTEVAFFFFDIKSQEFELKFFIQKTINFANSLESIANDLENSELLNVPQKIKTTKLICHVPLLFFGGLFCCSHTTKEKDCGIH